MDRIKPFNLFEAQHGGGFIQPSDRDYFRAVNHAIIGSSLLGNLAQQWGMEVEDVRGILFEGLDPDEVRGRIIRERRARRIGEITEDPGEGS